MARARQYWYLVALVLAVWPAATSADLLQSTHFRLDPNVAGTVGGASGSGSYKLTDSGGEAVVGAGSSQSYRLTQGYIAQLTHSLQLSVLPSGTYAYWPVDTGEGPWVYDVSLTNNKGTLQNNPAWTTGQIGQALILNGTNQYVSTAVTQTNPNTFTLELWFKTTTTQGGRLIGFGDAVTGASTNLDRHLYMTNGGQLIFGTKDGPIRTISSVSSYNDGNWHHVAATSGTEGLTLVVDGARVATDGTTTTGGNYTGSWRFGYDDLAGWPSAPTSNYFAGTLDEIRIYTRQLSDAEIAADRVAGQNGLRFAHTLPSVTPGSSTTYTADAVVRTDAPGYDLYIQAPQPLTHTNTTTTMPMISATVGSPAVWNETVTKGLGFTVTSGTQIEAKWGTGPYNYAGVPNVATVYHSRTGQNGGVAEKTSLQFRADASDTQPSGTYSTTIIYTATLKP